MFVFCVSQYVPVPEVSGGLGAGAAGRLRAGVPLRVPLAFLAFHSQCLRLLQIPGPGEYVCVRRAFHTDYGNK